MAYLLQTFLGGALLLVTGELLHARRLSHGLLLLLQLAS
jgi:hypothetical protein